MRLLIDMGHPAHVHFFRNMIRNLEGRGHEIMITARNKEVTLQLLDYYKLKYKKIGENHNSFFKKAWHMLTVDYKLLRIAKEFKPEIFIGVSSPYAAQVSRLDRAKSIIFTDTEYVKTTNTLSYPFADTICTPTCFREILDPKKHVRYNGYKEIAYLHPRYFKPDPSVLESLNLSKNDKFIILRFIAWKANHDIGLKGIKDEKEFIKELENYGHVFITSERKINEKLERDACCIPLEKLHSLLSFAQLYIGEGGTTAAESAILGTPAIHVEADSRGHSTGESSGNFLELRDKYNLLYFYPDEHQALAKAREIFENKNSKIEWESRRKKLLKDKIDVTAWMTDFIERYPESFYDYKGMKKI
jgi:predicted glycosyltransferase